MAFTPATPLERAWVPLTPQEWNPELARHLLRRIGFAATPDQVDHSVYIGLPATLQEAFGQIRPMPPSPSLTNYVSQRASVELAVRQATAAGDTPQNIQMLRAKVDAMRRQAFVDSLQESMAFARQPENSAQENLVMFLSNVLVVASNKVQDPDRLLAHIALLRANWQQPYPYFCKLVTYSPAMVQYLDLNTSVRALPNENYARELMELFTLGEGHYTETDVKEAARALTGAVLPPAINPNGDQAYFDTKRWDAGDKTLFGQTGPWGAYDVVDLIFTQPGARTLLPKRFLAWYLTDDPVPAPYLQSLGDLWFQKGWRIDELAKTVFSSKLFYDPSFRGALIKSPMRYYLGLCQDLELDVSPFEGQVFQDLRAMGQEPYNPPNVRGWVGGKTWINSSTLTARRELVQQMFAPLDETRLNADQKAMLANARAAGHGQVNVTPSRIQNVVALSNPELADHFLSYFLPGEPNPAYRAALIDYLQNSVGQRPELIRETVVALLQAPLYNLS
jgi:uncharacterized protein (DUF1800 family)